MARIAIPLLAVIFFAGCEGSAVKTQEQAQKNMESLLSLDIGMTEDEVLATMGKPNKKKEYALDERTIEFWFYLTEAVSLDYGRIREAEYTPLAFEKGKLIGWGRSFYNRLMYEQKLKSK